MPRLVGASFLERGRMWASCRLSNFCAVSRRCLLVFILNFFPNSNHSKFLFLFSSLKPAQFSKLDRISLHALIYSPPILFALLFIHDCVWHYWQQCYGELHNLSQDQFRCFQLKVHNIFLAKNVIQCFIVCYGQSSRCQQCLLCDYCRVGLFLIFFCYVCDLISFLTCSCVTLSWKITL